MTQDELREDIAEHLHSEDWDKETSMAYHYGTSGLWDEQDDHLKNFYLVKAERILALIKKAGYHSREEVLEISTSCVEEGRKVERLILETKGYVKLADLDLCIRCKGIIDGQVR